MRPVRLSEFRRGLLTTSFADVVARLLGAATVLLLVRTLKVGDYAFMTLFLALGQFLASAAGSGMRMHYLRTQAEIVSRGPGSTAVPGLEFGTVVRRQIGTTLVVAALGVMVSLALDLRAAGAALATICALAGLYAVGHSGFELVIMHHQACKRFSAAGVVSVTRNGVILALSLLPVFITAAAGGSTVAGLYALGLIVGAAVLLRPVLRAQKRLRSARAAHQAADGSIGWLTAYFVAAALFAYAGVFVVGSLLSRYDVAAFGSAQRYFAIALGAFPALLAVLRVRSSQVDVIESAGAQRRILTRWFRLAPIPAGVVLGLAAWFADDLVRAADGGRYPGSAGVLRLLLVLAFLTYLTAPVAAVLMAQCRYRPLALSMGVAAVANVGLGMASAAAWGAAGVAGATTVVFAGLCLFQAWLVFTPQVSREPAGVRGQSVRSGNYVPDGEGMTG
jgi:O-antigen/teichoic acid export membrane protein